MWAGGEGVAAERHTATSTREPLGVIGDAHAPGSKPCSKVPSVDAHTNAPAGGRSNIASPYEADVGVSVEVGVFRWRRRKPFRNTYDQFMSMPLVMLIPIRHHSQKLFIRVFVYQIAGGWR